MNIEFLLLPTHAVISFWLVTRGKIKVMKMVRMKKMSEV